MVKAVDVKETLHSFINNNDPPKKLLETLSSLTKIRSVVDDRLLKVDRDLDFIRNIFARHDERQGKGKRQKLTKGVAFF